MYWESSARKGEPHRKESQFGGATSLWHLLTGGAYSAEIIRTDEEQETKDVLLSWPFGTRKCQGNIQWQSHSGHGQCGLTSVTACPRSNCFGRRYSAEAHGVGVPLLFCVLLWPGVREL